MTEAEKVELRFEKVEIKPKNSDVAQDLKEGYVYFDVLMEANRKRLFIEKRVRLDKPDKMLNKFVTKIKALAEEQYKEQKYYVADKKPPAIDTVLTNEEEVNEKMGQLFDEIGQFIKTGNASVLGTKSVEF